jgi:hypothetical protein
MADVCDTFPTAKDGAALKDDFFGPTRKQPSLLPRFAEADILRGFAACRRPEAFDASRLKLRSRASALWQSDQEAGSKLLREMLVGTQRELSEEIMVGLAQAMSAHDACRLASEKPVLLPALVTRNLRLATDGELWSCPVGPQTLYDVLDVLQISKDDLAVAEWIPAVVTGGPPAIAHAIFERFEADATTALLNWFSAEKSNRSLLPIAWQDALLTRQDEVLDWLRHAPDQCKPETLALAAATLNPHSPGVASLGLSPWLHLVEYPRFIGQYPHAQPAAFLLAIGLTNRSTDAQELVATTFELVHEAAASDQLDYRAWQFLKSLLPPIRWGREWDKCERLRRALVAWLRDKPITASEFLRMIQAPTLFRKLLESAEEVNDGEAFFRDVAGQVASHAVSASEAQRQALKEGFPRSTWGRLRRELL